jgi:ATP-dependent helicase/nuclease subunit A
MFGGAGHGFSGKPVAVLAPVSYHTDLMDQLNLFADVPAPPAATGPPLPDAAARARIREDLDSNLLIEAGAGAGKTTEMVRRMVALVASGRAEASQIAAVTFTRKAAAELRERFQTALERELAEALRGGDSAVAGRLDLALRQIDRAFLGTIHAFCARLLRERPLDAGIDPAFRETLGSEEQRLRQRFWLSWLERLSAEGDPSLAELRDVALRPPQLEALYTALVGQPDVVYPLERVERPNAAFLRRRLEQLLDEALAQLPSREPPGGWDPCQKTIRKLRFHRDVLGWEQDTTFLDIIGELTPNSFKPTLRRWLDRDVARALGDELRSLFGPGGAAHELRRQWWAYRYPIALGFANRAAAAYGAERLRAGTLNFQDLLMLAARLLRDSPAARRELGERYRFLLVDEFQDTDPIQAEVLFLLASDEELDLFTDTPAIEHAGEWLPPFASWRHLRPRPGALFVVGDPKQSIYRFRRADMTLYQQVKRRFAEFGGVLELVTNFRSRPAIETFVNDIFRSTFPPEETDVQARFAPMRVFARPRPPIREGVFWYELDDPVMGKVEQLAQQDANRLAAWVDARIREGERRPGDFLILTPTKGRLETYAKALEAYDVPVQVTGSGVGEGDELHELRLLLRALADPGDPSLTVAVLVGLFFGLDFEQLTEFALGPREPAPSPGEPDGTDTPEPGDTKAREVIGTGTHEPGDAEPAASVRQQPRRFSFTSAPESATSPVAAALARLNRFWHWTRTEPADVAVPRIVAELGLVPLAGAAELGASRAGALLFALDAIRAAALAGDASLAGAIAALDAALDEDDSEAPLEPGRSDVVRVMNLHKAKGLEAPVVVLACPFSGGNHEPTQRVVRDDAGRALGYIAIIDGHRHYAQPLDWETVHAPEETRFDDAEEDRLLYVAATRAAEELVVSCAYNSNSKSRWTPFHDWLQRHGTRITLPDETQRPRRERLEATREQLETAIAEAAARRAAAARPSYRLAAVTSRKGEVLPRSSPEAELPVPAGGWEPPLPTGAHAPVAPLSYPPASSTRDEEADIVNRGTAWGTAVHDALLEAARGLAGDRLRSYCRTLLVGLGRDLDESGNPAELEELLGVVATVLASPLWARARVARHTLLEAPFALSMSAEEYALALGREAPAADAAPLEILDGRIDLVFQEADGWVIVDYKSDAGGRNIPPELLQRYRGQLALYGAAWERLTGQVVKERVLLFTATGELEPA